MGALANLIGAALVLNLGTAAGVLYSINETEYARMPPSYALEEYDTCLQRAGAAYCVLDAELLSDGPSELLRLVQEYSEYTLKHFNHTQIHRGMCSGSCARAACTAPDCLKASLEGCLNDTIFKEYGLQARVTGIRYCDREGEKRSLDASEITVAVIYLLLLLMNVLGSYYDGWLRRRGNNNEGGNGNGYLLAFSVRRNWAKLTAGDGSDKRKSRLRAIHGFRTMTMFCVLFSHTVLIMAHAYIDNPLYIEKSYDDPMKQILFNGSLVTQTFFTMSALLLAYNYQIFAETHKSSWLHYPRGLLNRWLRLTPTYALVLATICTWARRVGSGPQWRLVVESEADACRRYWWSHLLYINNYVYDNAYCMPQTWYLAADTQLFSFGLALATAAWRLGARARRQMLAVALVAGVLAPALHTILQDLDAVVLQSPESYRNLYDHDDTFRLVYSRGHTNLAGHALGLIAGYLLYSWQKDGDLQRLKRFRWLVWVSFPAGVGIILTGGVFYIDGARAPLAARALYAALYKPVFCLCVLTIMLGAFLKVESVYRGVTEWRGWRVCGRVSYCAFLLHTLLQRGLVGAARHPIYMSDYYVFVVLAATIFLTYALAVPLCLLVEMPLSHAQRLVLGEGRARRAPGVPLADTRPSPLQSKL